MKNTFINTVNQAVEKFQDNALFTKLTKGDLKMEDYHQILLMIFHQTYEGPATFSLAAAHTPSSFWFVRDYLQHHADEEKSHWQWVIGDLKNPGYAGPDPRTLLPQTACQAY